MLNDISERQRLPEFVDQIAASSKAYATVKQMATTQSVLALSAAALGPIVSWACPACKAWAALYALCILLFDIIFLEPTIKQKQELGARIQEAFDTDLFRIPWNSFLCDPRPDPETIHNLATKFKKTETTDRLLDWYPLSASELPIEYGRLVCQRANMRWDSTLRRGYFTLYVVLIFFMVIIAPAVSLYLKWDADRIVVSVLMPLLPAALKLFREGRKHQDSASASEKSKSILEKIWHRGLTETVPQEEFLEASRRLQDTVFERRKSSPTVPQRVYMWFRDEYETDMRIGSEKMVLDAKNRLGINT
ncbi:MAG: hypothetical protein JNM43_27590 [Planctomycetaceae bacterium]|nr:hypothetical protein [Planctomycetaceae bacterium]